MSALPQFQEMKAKFAVHINICQGGLAGDVCVCMCARACVWCGVVWMGVHREASPSC